MRGTLGRNASKLRSLLRKLPFFIFPGDKSIKMLMHQMTCLQVHFREKEVRKALRKLRKDMGSNDIRKKAKKRRELTLRGRALQLPWPRPTAAVAAPLRWLEEKVNSDRVAARSRMCRCANVCLVPK
ncbi:hypothetical protein PIB30_086537 [Stylosanthes scabra]|uniref:Uncharacterized protein n=1 Tax=Stylosanthes scabra TaxID=79078 RepID=A0ABU6SVF3_9FABA|nr:hypothetical protein [Stylosanthes scabra]